MVSSFLLGNTDQVGRGPPRERHEKWLQKSSRFGEKMLNLDRRTLKSFKAFEAGE